MAAAAARKEEEERHRDGGRSRENARKLPNKHSSEGCPVADGGDDDWADMGPHFAALYGGATRRQQERQGRVAETEGVVGRDHHHDHRRSPYPCPNTTGRGPQLQTLGDGTSIATSAEGCRIACKADELQSISTTPPGLHSWVPKIIKELDEKHRAEDRHRVFEGILQASRFGWWWAASLSPSQPTSDTANPRAVATQKQLRADQLRRDPTGFWRAFITRAVVDPLLDAHIEHWQAADCYGSAIKERLLSTAATGGGRQQAVRGTLSATPTASGAVDNALRPDINSINVQVGVLLWVGPHSKPSLSNASMPTTKNESSPDIVSLPSPFKAAPCTGAVYTVGACVTMKGPSNTKTPATTAHPSCDVGDGQNVMRPPAMFKCHRAITQLPHATRLVLTEIALHSEVMRYTSPSNPTAGYGSGDVMSTFPLHRQVGLTPKVGLSWIATQLFEPSNALFESPVSAPLQDTDTDDGGRTNPLKFFPIHVFPSRATTFPCASVEARRVQRSTLDADDVLSPPFLAQLPVVCWVGAPPVPQLQESSILEANQQVRASTSFRREGVVADYMQGGPWSRSGNKCAKGSDEAVVRGGVGPQQGGVENALRFESAYWQRMFVVGGGGGDGVAPAQSCPSLRGLSPSAEAAVAKGGEMDGGRLQEGDHCADCYSPLTVDVASFSALHMAVSMPALQLRTGPFSSQGDSPQRRCLHVGVAMTRQQMMTMFQFLEGVGVDDGDVDGLVYVVPIDPSRLPDVYSLCGGTTLRATSCTEEVDGDGLQPPPPPRALCVHSQDCLVRVLGPAPVAVRIWASDVYGCFRLPT